MQQNIKPAYLIIRQGARWTDVFRMDPHRPVVVGRASANEIPVSDERSSRRHAEFFYENGWVVRDLGSRNGTWVDGQRIQGNHPLLPGQTIVVASCRMQFTEDLNSTAPVSLDSVAVDAGSLTAVHRNSAEEGSGGSPQTAPNQTVPHQTTVNQTTINQTTVNREPDGVVGSEFSVDSPSPSITYRRSKSEILDPASVDLPSESAPKHSAGSSTTPISPHATDRPPVLGSVRTDFHANSGNWNEGQFSSASVVRERKDDAGASSATAPTTTFPAQALLQLAFKLAKETNLSDGCELAIARLIQETAGKNFGILKYESVVTEGTTYSERTGLLQNPASEIANKKDHSDRITASSSPQEIATHLPSSDPGQWILLATTQNSNRVYTPPNPSLLTRVLKDNEAILARDSRLQSAGGNDASIRANSLTLDSIRTTILAPIRFESQCLGVIHIYNRFDEPDLQPNDLEIALALADVLGTFFSNLTQLKSLESKLQTTATRVNELEVRLAQSEQWIGKSASLRQIQEQVGRIARTKATVLLRGESGVGKEIVARKIHETSPCANGPFIALNCAALSPTLLESELFGHEKGAFTGATERKLGKFEQAHKGTLMLDELGEMSLETQTKFLRVLENGNFERVGGAKSIQVDVRVIAATNKDLESAVASGEFRADLYFRLRIIELRIPPLRERVDDILLIAEHYLKLFRQRSGTGPIGFTDRAIEAMKAYAWPGNVRELRNAVERAHVLGSGQLAEPEDLALSNLQIPGQSAANVPFLTANDASMYIEKTLEEIEYQHIQATLQHTGGQKNRAAAILGIERSTLDRKLKRMKSDT